MNNKTTVEIVKGLMSACKKALFVYDQALAQNVAVTWKGEDVDAMRDAVADAKDFAGDWRLGLSCKPKFRSHDLYYERGEIIDVLPSGTGGIFDADGVLKIRMETGKVIMASSHEWITA